MAEELTPQDVDDYTEGRLAADNPRTATLLAAALDKVRRFCGWHVSPIKDDVATLHTNGRHDFFVLPTLNIASITSITEDGQAVDLSTIEQVTGEPGVIYKQHGRRWCGTVVANYSHGYAAADAAAFRAEVLALVDRADLSMGTGASGPLTSIEVDDVRYGFSGVTDRIIGGVAKNPLDESVLYQYRLVL